MSGRAGVACLFAPRVSVADLEADRERIEGLKRENASTVQLYRWLHFIKSSSLKMRIKSLNTTVLVWLCIQIPPSKKDTATSKTSPVFFGLQAVTIRPSRFPGYPNK